MLFSAENTRAVTATLGEYFQTHGRIPLVCDPVCVSTSGHVLLQSDAVDSMIRELFPLSQVITPNQAEAELLLRERCLPCSFDSLGDMLVAARNLLTLGSDAVLLKGGHIFVSEDDIQNVRVPEGATLDVRPAFLLGENTEVLQRNGPGRVTDLVVDVLCQRDVKTITLYPRPRLQSKSTHGTGCTLSAALACALGNGIPGEGCRQRSRISFLILCSARSGRASDFVYASRHLDRPAHRKRIRPFEPPPLGVEARGSSVSVSFSRAYMLSVTFSAGGLPGIRTH
jgi:hydroxymethylpyrimidine/phosphomethylpyrimidine kinase